MLNSSTVKLLNIDLIRTTKKCLITNAALKKISRNTMRMHFMTILYKMNQRLFIDYLLIKKLHFGIILFLSNI